MGIKIFPFPAVLVHLIIRFNWVRSGVLFIRPFEKSVKSVHGVDRCFCFLTCIWQFNCVCAYLYDFENHGKSSCIKIMALAVYSSIALSYNLNATYFHNAN